jgi:hypothetical protein
VVCRSRRNQQRTLCCLHVTMCAVFSADRWLVGAPALSWHMPLRLSYCALTIEVEHSCASIPSETLVALQASHEMVVSRADLISYSSCLQGKLHCCLLCRLSTLLLRT